MADTIAQMTMQELEELIEKSIEEKLLDLFGDPDAGLEIRQNVRERLLEQQRELDSGKQGDSFEDIVRQLGLE